MADKPKMSFKDAAIEILKESGEPLSYKEIASRAVEQGILNSEGKTPAATMGAQLYVDIKKNKKSKFKKVGKGTFTLQAQTESVSSPLLLIQKQNEKVRDALRARLLEMDPFQFEFLIGDLLQAIGYEDVEVTKSRGDKGIDVMANLTLEGVTSVKTVIQVKRYKIGNNIPGKVITQLRGSAEVDQRGLVITTSEFTKDAISESKAPNKMPVSLINGERLLDFLMKYGVGIKKESLEVYSVDTDYFAGEDKDTGPTVAAHGKNKVIWPLPGGTTTYIDTLLLFLSAINEGKDTKEKLVQWFMGTFTAVKSLKSSASYVTIPKYMGLIHFTNNKIGLTDAGKSFLETQDTEFLYQTVSENILAFNDIVEFLANANEPQSLHEIRDYITENFDVNWTTNAQVTYRVLWLINLGKIKKEDSGYTAV